MIHVTQFIFILILKDAKHLVKNGVTFTQSQNQTKYKHLKIITSNSALQMYGYRPKKNSNANGKHMKTLILLAFKIKSDYRRRGTMLLVAKIYATKTNNVWLYGSTMRLKIARCSMLLFPKLILQIV